MEHILTSKVRVEMLNLSFYSTMTITVNKDVFFLHLVIATEVKLLYVILSTRRSRLQS